MTSPAQAAPAVSAMLAELFDDAGLFPPASMPMSEAFDAHRTARQGNYRWMLGRFVCPVSRLQELAVAAPRYGDALRLSLIVDDEEAAEEAPAIIDDHGWRVEAVEARLADNDVDAHDLRRVAELVGAPLRFLEVPWQQFPLEALPDAVAAIAKSGAGVKIRCGGEKAEDVPPPGLLAALIAACARSGAALKATAGLHHPFRHPDADTDAVGHGFINLVVASSFARQGMDETDVAGVLTDDDASAFAVDGARLRWRGSSLSSDELSAARRELLVAVGTCSFREPIDDLVAFGLLPVP